ITPVRIADTTPPPVLRPLIAPALFGIEQGEARRVLLAAVNGPSRPQTEPAFPGGGDVAAGGCEWSASAGQSAAGVESPDP
ncbi:hypothetical protein, partial [Streptomyces sp. TLI_55]|uniref:hypothetical protein n=1 Tax=Streptomyces sp. TLI_55 TaxID=1938861 RepID=UPI001C53C3C3